MVPLTCDYEEAFAAILALQDADQLLQGLLAVDEYALLVLGQAVVSGTKGSEHLDRWHDVSITLQKKVQRSRTFSGLFTSPSTSALSRAASAVSYPTFCLLSRQTEVETAAPPNDPIAARIAAAPMPKSNYMRQFRLNASLQV